MTRYKLDEKTGMIWMLPGNSTKEEAMDVLGKALCMNTEKLTRAVSENRPVSREYPCIFNAGCFYDSERQRWYVKCANKSPCQNCYDNGAGVGRERRASRAIGCGRDPRVWECVPVVPEHERGDLP